ncbi:unnamed protein product [Nyctereutes procyonoides]|uniref:Phosphoserine phosphatase n=1 Tax=Nyctereutes procyonoides TaxID=34880 RepID=A0A811Z393_NYCPR|nr:unnamed protein product [Nyctereutes procyonoides]
MRKILPRLVSHAELRKLSCSAHAVWFEVDSTIIREDGIDELAKFHGWGMHFMAALTEHSALIQPARDQVPWLIELVSRLQYVFLLSSDFRNIVEHLSIPLTNVLASKLKFYFDANSQIWWERKVFKFVKEKFHFKKMVMIRDGAIDMEFVGNVITQLKDNSEWYNSEWYITDFVELLGEFAK